MFGLEYYLLANMKKLFLLLLGTLGEKRNDQEVLLALGDMMIAVFALESSVLRADKVMSGASARKRGLLQSAVRVATFNELASFQLAANRCAAYGTAGEELSILQKSIARHTSYPLVGLLDAKRQLADAVAETGGYLF